MRVLMCFNSKSQHPSLDIPMGNGTFEGQSFLVLLLHFSLESFVLESKNCPSTLFANE